MCHVTIDLKRNQIVLSGTVTPEDHAALSKCRRLVRDEFSGVYHVMRGAAWQAALKEAEIAVKS